MTEESSKPAPGPHDFRDHKAHMLWQTERSSYATAVPMIPTDMSEGSRASAMSASVLSKAFGNPFVPLGMLATVGCLVGMLSSTLKRNPNRAQIYMRGRVLAQGLTVVALVGGAMLFGIGGAPQQPSSTPATKLPLGPPRAQPSSG